MDIVYYVDIMTGEKSPFNFRGGDVVNMVVGESRYFSQLQVSLYSST